MSQNNYYNNNNNNSSGSGSGGSGGRYSGSQYSGGSKKSINYANGGSSYRSSDAMEWESSGRRSGRDYYSGYRGSGGGGGSSYSRYDQYGGRERDRTDRGPDRDRDRDRASDRGDRERDRGGYKSHKSSYVPSGNPRDRERENRRRYDKYDSYSGGARAALSGSGSSSGHASSYSGAANASSGRYSRASSGSQSEYRRNLPIEGSQDPRRGSFQGDFRKTNTGSGRSGVSSRNGSPNPANAPTVELKDLNLNTSMDSRAKSDLNEKETKPERDTTSSTVQEKESDIKGKESISQETGSASAFHKSEGSNSSASTDSTTVADAPTKSEENIGVIAKAETKEREEETVVEKELNDTNAENTASLSPVAKTDGEKPKIEKTSDFDIANSSMLSPVGESAFDELFLKHMAPIVETNTANDEGEVSEAETIPTNSPPRVNMGRRLVRKLELDQERARLKRSYYSDEDEEESLSKLGDKKDLVRDSLLKEESSDEASIEKKEVSEGRIDKKSQDDAESGHSEHSDKEEEEEEDEDEEDDDDQETEVQQDLSKSKIIDRPYKLKRDSTGRSLLQRACGKGSLKEVKDYIERGADPNECDYCGFTCLHEAALEGHSKVAEYLISQGADVNKQAQKAGDLETPLIDAAENKHLETVKVLLTNGADPRIYNLDGFTALTKIFNEHEGEPGYEKIIQLLEEANLKFNREEIDTSRDKLREDVCAIPRAVEDPNDVYFSDLLKKKNHANSIYKYAAEGLKEFTANYFVEGGRLDHKPDILILAARNGHLELVDIILGLNPGPYDIDQENGCGLTALVASVGRGHTEIVKFLLTKGADPSRIRKQDGLSCLEIAQGATHYDIEEVKILQKHLKKSSSNTVDNDDQTDNKLTEESSPTPKRKKEALEFKKETDSKKRKLPTSSLSEELDKGFKKSKSKEPEKTQERLAEKVHEKPFPQPKPSSVFAKEATPENSEPPKSKKATLSPKPEEGSFKRPSGSLSPVSVAAQSQIPVKEQEEWRNKNAEEARQWQEKVEAKKRARRDMFLRAEREKERKRKEDEERRAKEEEESARAKIEEDKQKAIEEAHIVKEITEQRNSLERELIFKNYPIGLQQVTEDIPSEEFGPLYTFKVDNSEVVYVTDLQVALLTRSNAQTLSEGVSLPDLITPVTPIQKSKIWNLFFPMIGIDRRSPFTDIFRLFHEGHEKFKNLVINFIPLEEVSEILKEKLKDEVELEHIRVDLESLQEFAESGSDHIVPSCGGDNLEVVINSDALLESRFVPPRLRRRADVLKTLQTTSIPLW